MSLSPTSGCCAQCHRLVRHEGPYICEACDGFHCGNSVAESEALRARVVELEAAAEKWLAQRDAAFEREEALRLELAAAREVLARDDVQWGGDGICRSCGAIYENGHFSDCPIGAELAKRGEK